MFSHRFLAAPWMARHAAERCLWCGRTRSLAQQVEIAAGGKRVIFAACDVDHRNRAGRFFTFVARFRHLIAAGIFVPLVLLISGTIAVAAGYPFIAPEWNRLQFRMVVAITVSGTSLAYLLVKKTVEPLTSPFPLHNLFLLGVSATLWVFRIVGGIWLALGAMALWSGGP
jgi:hypothetical protein